MQWRPNLYEESTRCYFSKRKCFSTHNIFKHNEMMQMDAFPSVSSSQPELRGRSIEDDRISSRASSTKGFKTTIPVRETNASKLRRIFLSTERLQRHEQSTKSTQEKPRWHVSSKVRYKVNSGISRIYDSKIKRNEQNDGSEFNLRKSKSDISDQDYKVSDNPKAELKLLPHICHLGSFMEVRFPNLEQKRSTLLRNDAYPNLDLKFVISSSDLQDAAEKLKEQSLFILNNRKEMNSSFVNLNVADGNPQTCVKVPHSKECECENFQNWENNKTEYVGPSTNGNMHSTLQSRLEFISYGRSSNAKENPGDILHNSSGFIPCSQEQSNTFNRKRNFEAKDLKRNGFDPTYQVNFFERYHSENEMVSPASDSNLLQNGVTITSRKYIKNERIETEGKLTTKIPQPIASASIKKSMPAKTRSAFTLKKTFNSEESLSNIPQYQELGSKQSKTSLNEQLTFESKLQNREEEKEKQEAADKREFSYSGDSQSTLQKSDEAEKIGFFDNYNFIQKQHSEKNSRLGENLPTEISQGPDNQLVCLPELGKQLNTGNRLNIQTIENPPKTLPEMCVEKEIIPKAVLSQQPVAEPTVCQERLRVCAPIPRLVSLQKPYPASSSKVKCTTLKDRIVQCILNQLQDQATLDLDILLFKSILLVAFILIFLYDWSNDFKLFQFCGNFLKK